MILTEIRTVGRMTNSHISGYAIHFTEDAQFKDVAGEHSKPAAIHFDRKAQSLRGEE
jgi:hypothetical protein